MIEQNEPTMLGLSADAHQMLTTLKQSEVFSQMADGYRFAIGLAIAHGGISKTLVSSTTTFSVGTVDPEGDLRTAIRLLYPDERPTYRFAERLADWGVREIYKRFMDDRLEFSEYFADTMESEKANGSN